MTTDSLNKQTLIEKLAEWHCNRQTQKVIDQDGAATYWKDLMPVTKQSYYAWAEELLAIIREHKATPSQDAEVVEVVARAIYETDPRAGEDGYWMLWEVYKHADEQEYERLVMCAKAAIAAYEGKNNGE